MTVKLFDRIRETSNTTGTGAMTLAGTVPGCRRFASVYGVGDTLWYTILGANGEWETGLGTYSASDTLTRTAVFESSNANAVVPFGSGTKDVFVSQPASKALERYPRQVLTASGSLTDDDHGKLIQLAGTGGTLSLAAAAQLGDTFRCDVRATGLGVWVIDPNGAETIDGRTTIRVYPGESFTIQGNGTDFLTVGRSRRFLVSDVTLTTAAAIDVESFAGDPELERLEFEFQTVTANAFLLFKKAGAYAAATSGTYTTQLRISQAANNTSQSNTNAFNISAGVFTKGQIVSVQSAAANGVRLYADSYNGTQWISYAGTESTAGAFTGLRLAAASGNFGIGTVFRVWGCR